MWELAPYYGTSTHEGAFLSLFNLPTDLAPKYLTALMFGAFCRVEILFARMNYAHEIVGTHEGALFPERTTGAKPRSETSCVYLPLCLCLRKH